MKKIYALITLMMLLTLSSWALATTNDKNLFDRDSASADGQRFQHRGERGGDRGRRGARWHQVAEQLGLTEAQKAQLQQLRKDHHNSVKPAAQELRARQKDLRDSIEGSSTYDEAATAQKMRDMADLKAKVVGEKFKMRQSMMAVLTPEQRVKFEQMKAEAKARRAERHNKFRGI